MSQGVILLPTEAIVEYQALYKQEYGQDISYEEAQRQGLKLLNLYDAIYRPVKKNWIKEVEKKINKGGTSHV